MRISPAGARELRLLLPWSLALDVLCYLGSLFFVGPTVSMALGLLLGTAVMTVNFILLANSLEDAVRRYRHAPSGKSVKYFAMRNYLLRYLIAGAALALSFVVNLKPWLNPVGVALPLVYPKLIYMIYSLAVEPCLNKKGKEE